MKNALLALFVVPLLTVPAIAGFFSAGDKPMIVAEDVGVGGRQRRRWRRRATPVAGTMVTSTCPRDTAITMTIAMTIAAKISHSPPPTHRSEQFDTDLGSAGRKVVSTAQALPLAPEPLAPAL